MKFKYLKEKLLSEKWLDGREFKPEFRQKDYYELFVNPSSSELKSVGEFARGWVDSKGNLYVASNKLVHTDISVWLRTKNITFSQKWLMNMNTKDAIPVQRLESTNEFYISESMPLEKIVNDDDLIDKMFKKAEKKNPAIDFVPLKINQMTGRNAILP